MQETDLMAHGLNNEAYQTLVGKISGTYSAGQVKAVNAVNIQLLETY